LEIELCIAVLFLQQLPFCDRSPNYGRQQIIFN
jgi:hypothetical protein